MTDKTMLLETYDPKWEEKFDRIMPRVQELNEKGRLTNEEMAEHKSLAALLCTICDAGLRTPDDYLRRHLSFTIPEADKLGIWAWWPQIPDDADIDAVRAAVAEVAGYVDAVKRRREIIAACRRARMKPRHLPKVPKLSWRTRWAMLKFRLGRRRRLAARGSV